jgi:hypothetical protein
VTRTIIPAASVLAVALGGSIITAALQILLGR